MIQPDLIQMPDDFPMMISVSKGVSPLFQRLHWHRSLEINLITSGTGTYIINGQEYHFAAGDVFLIDSHDLHRAYEGMELEMVVIMFEPSLLSSEQRYNPEIMLTFRQTGSLFPNRIPAAQLEAANARLGEYIVRMLEEYQSEQSSRYSVLHGCLLLLLAEVQRHFRQPEKAPKIRPAVRHLEMIRESIQRMESDLVRAWTLSELAKQAHLSPSRFSALFSQAAGMSPMNYLLQLRLDHAVQLLEQSSLSILEIADRSGFRNLSNFNRLFLRYVGKPPSAMRRKLQGKTAMSLNQRSYAEKA